MVRRRILWVVEFRWGPRHRWEFENAFETRAEAEECRWEPIPPAEYRIVKYTCEEKRKQ
jgi:hypothetical protein